MNGLALFAGSAAIGYLLGSIPCGQIAGAVAGVDLRRHGSGKTGATNALRTLGPGAGAAVLLGDFAKGAAAVLVARALAGPGADEPIAEAVGAFAAVIGHNWPVYIGFRGGRGVAVSYAGFVLMCWPAALLDLAVSAVILAAGRMVSLASLSGAVIGVVLLAGFVAWDHYPFPYLIYGLLSAILIWVRHADNIQRLLAGTERKIGQKAQPIAEQGS